MNVEVAVSDVDEYKADDRGRITIGSDVAEKKVTVAVLDVEEPDDGE